MNPASRPKDRFIRRYATTILGCPPDAVGPLAAQADGACTDVEMLRAEVNRLRAAIRAACGQDVPDDPTAQLRPAVEAVFRSCGSRRARAYLQRERG